MMVTPVKLCGAHISRGVPIALGVGSVLSFAGATTCFWKQASAECFDDEEWFDWSCSTYKTHLITYGFACLVAGVALLGTAAYMVYKILKNRDFIRMHSEPDIRVVKGAYDGFQSHAKPFFSPDQKPDFFS